MVVLVQMMGCRDDGMMVIKVATGAGGGDGGSLPSMAFDRRNIPIPKQLF